MDKKLTGVELIAIERQEQIEKHGRTIRNDAWLNDDHQLSQAASILISFYRECDDEDDIIEYHCPTGWDRELWAKMVRKPYKERVKISGALAAAELDRLNALNKQEDK